MDDSGGGAGITVQLVHTVWSGILTLIGGIMVFFGKRLFDAVDAKADIKDVDKRFEEFRDETATQFDRIERAILGNAEISRQQHRDNTQLLNQILLGVRNNDPR